MGFLANFANGASKIAQNAFKKPKPPQITGVDTTVDENGKETVVSKHYDGMPVKNVRDKIEDFTRKTRLSIAEQYRNGERYARNASVHEIATKQMTDNVNGAGGKLAVAPKNMNGEVSHNFINHGAKSEQFLSSMNSFGTNIGGNGVRKGRILKTRALKIPKTRKAKFDVAPLETGASYGNPNYDFGGYMPMISGSSIVSSPRSIFDFTTRNPRKTRAEMDAWNHDRFREERYQRAIKNVQPTYLSLMSSQSPSAQPFYRHKDDKADVDAFFSGVDGGLGQRLKKKNIYGNAFRF